MKDTMQKIMDLFYADNDKYISAYDRSQQKNYPNGIVIAPEKKETR